MRSSIEAQSCASVPPAPAYVHEAAVRVERVVEHAAELERADVGGELGNVIGDAEERGVVVLRLRHVEELLRVLQAGVDAGELADGRVERLLLPPELLRALLVVPDAGVGEGLLYFGEALLLAIEVKDTSAAPPTACSGRRARRRAG